MDDNAGFHAGDDAAVCLRVTPHIDEHAGTLAAHPWRRDRGAFARKKRLIDPAFRAVGIAYPPPVVIFLDDFHGNAGPQVAPGDRVVDARADAQIDALGFQADKAGQRQAACALCRLREDRCSVECCHRQDGDGDEEEPGKEVTHDEIRFPKKFENLQPKL